MPTEKMIRPTAENLWCMTQIELSSFLDKEHSRDKPRHVRFYAPSFMYYRTSYFCSSANIFPTISVTGKDCPLKCKHCGGVVLDTMIPATTPKALYALCEKLKKEGALGCLISGGCSPTGAVPLQRFIDTIGRVKHELGLTVFVHTGIVDLPMANALRKADIDAALLDIIGSDETIRNVCKLAVTVKDYENSIRALNSAGIAYVPHVIVGLDYGKLKGEFSALKMISQFRPSALVIIAFMPIHGTEMANVRPPGSLEIARVIATAREMFPETPLVLGCMRPRGQDRSQTEILAIKAGTDAIAFPTEEAVKFAESSGYLVSFSPFCCSQIYVDMRVSITSEQERWSS
jgi:uncharacterized radical SAM superfamily protein